MTDDHWPPAAHANGLQQQTNPGQFPSSPYRGIDYYRFVDAPIFFARQDETFELFRNAVIHKGVILFGSSGAGKSSLINAGLLPLIIDQGFVADRIRFQNRPGQEIVIERISLNDNGEEPFLSPSLGAIAGEEDKSQVVLSLQIFKEWLYTFARNEKPLLILDQFEEIITLFEESVPSQGTSNSALALQEQILDLIVGFLHDESLDIKVLFAFREDYLAKLSKLFRLAPELSHQYLRLTLPQKKSLPDIITGPLKDELRKRYGREQSFSEELVSKLIEEFTRRSEGDAINLSEVQIVCQELWQADDPDALFELRGVQGLLEDWLVRELSEFSEEQRSLAEGLLGHMLTSLNTRNFISGEELIRLFQKEDSTLPRLALEDALKALVKTRLVRRELRHKDYFYEIVSEFLVPWIIEQKSQRQSKLERLKLEAENYEERERERANQKLKQLRLVLAFAGLTIVLALGSAFVLWKQRQQEQELRKKAEDAESLANAERTEQQAIVNIISRVFKSPRAQVPLGEPELKEIKDRMAKDKLDGLRYISFLINQNKFLLDQISEQIGSLVRYSDPETKRAAQDVLNQVTAAKAKQNEQATQEKLDAIKEVKALMDKDRFPPELVLSLLGPTLGKDPNPTVSSAMGDLLTAASAKNGALGDSIANAANNNPAIADIVSRVYIQIESQQQSGKASSIKTELEKSGYVVPAFEVVAFRAPRRPELRFYRQDDKTRADKIVELLKNLQLDVKPIYLPGYENSTKLRPGHYELWLATQSQPGQDSYLVINYSPGTEERKASLRSLILPIIEPEGGKMEDLSAREWLLGPYAKDQGTRIRQKLIEQDSNLQQRIIIIRR